MVEEHPRHHCRVASREFPTTSVVAPVLPPAHPKDGGKRAAQGTLDAGTTSSPVGFSACDRLRRPGAQSEPRYTDGTAQGMTMHNPSSACETHAAGPTTIVKDTTSVLKGLTQRRLEALCVTLIS
jgi:hypothetical protein